MLVATGPALNLAAAGGIELSEASDIATNVMGGMALKVGDLNMVNDVLAKHDLLRSLAQVPVGRHAASSIAASAERASTR